ncbi:MAG: CDP-alcohol phosphatidyltransferase family protein [Candidatus Kapaibacteriota bacterium]|jgi:cardiolipin synthase
MTIPNILSLTRLILAFIIGYLLFTEQKNFAILLIFFAWVTDLLDGYLARKLKAISELGKILDPLADKLLVLIIVISLVAKGVISTTTSLFVIGRDITILAAGLFAARKYKFVIPSNIVGKVSAFLIGFSLFILLLFNPQRNVSLLVEFFIDSVVVVSLVLYSIYYLKWLKKFKSS